MTKFLYVLKDLKVGFMDPFCAQNDGFAVRGFGDLVNNDSTLVGKHYEDFELYRIGEVDTDTMSIVPKFEFICGGASCKKN